MANEIPRRALLRHTGLAAAGIAAAAAGLVPHGVAQARPGKVRNLPASFYERPGLEGMPRIDYEALPVVNVRNFGARADGRTSDQQAFDAAVDDLTARGGGIVYVPPGRYLFTPAPAPEPAYWRKTLSNIHFVGEGEKSVIQFQTPGIVAPGDYAPRYHYAEGWAFPEAADISVRALSFCWSPFLQMRDSHPWYTLVLYRGDGAQLIGVMADGGQPALWIPEGRDKWVVDCVVRNAGSDAIHFESATDSVGAYNYVENANDDGLANYTNTRVTPDTSQIGNVRLAYNTVLFTGWGRGLTFGGSRQSIDHNWIEAQVEAGIYTDVGIFEGAPDAPLYDAVASDNTLIRNNLAQREDNAFFRYGTGGYQGSICVRDEIQGMRIERNDIYGSGVHGMTFGIENWRPLGGSGLTVTDNRLAGHLGAGLRFIPTAEVDDVAIVDNTILATGGPSVLVEGTLTGTTTSGNDVSVAPSVVGTVDGDFSGFRIVDGEPAYRDVYREFRTAPGDTGWADAPTRPASLPAAVADVRRFGARGDGRHDDVESFVRALDSLPPEGGVLRIPPGRYRLGPVAPHDSAPFTRVRHHLLVSGRKNVHIQGAGESSVLVFTSPDHQGLRLLDVEDCSVSRLRLELAAPYAFRRNRALLELSAARGTVVDDVTVANSAGPGILVDSSRGVAVRDVTVRRAGTFGIEVAASRQVLVEGCAVSDARDHGIYLNWLGSIALPPQYVRVAGNRVSGTREGAAVALVGGDHVAVDGNHLSNTCLAGIYLYSRSPNFPHQHIELTDNTLVRTNTGRLSYTPGAIALHALQRGRTSADVLISGNVITRTPNSAIWVGGATPVSSKFADLARLVITDNTASGIGGAPVDISDEQRQHIDELIVT